MLTANLAIALPVEFCLRIDNLPEELSLELATQHHIFSIITQRYGTIKANTVKAALLSLLYSLLYGKNGTLILRNCDCNLIMRSQSSSTAPSPRPRRFRFALASPAQRQPNRQRPSHSLWESCATTPAITVRDPISCIFHVFIYTGVYLVLLQLQAKMQCVRAAPSIRALPCSTTKTHRSAKTPSRSSGPPLRHTVRLACTLNYSFVIALVCSAIVSRIYYTSNIAF